MMLAPQAEGQTASPSPSNAPLILFKQSGVVVILKKGYAMPAMLGVSAGVDYTTVSRSFKGWEQQGLVVQCAGGTLWIPRDSIQTIKQ